jgi:hypothetical protein
MLGQTIFPHLLAYEAGVGVAAEDKVSGKRRRNGQPVDDIRIRIRKALLEMKNDEKLCLLERKSGARNKVRRPLLPGMGIASPSSLCTVIKPESPSAASTSIVLHSFCHAVSWPPRPFWGLSSANAPTRTACCVQSSNHYHDGL